MSSLILPADATRFVRLTPAELQALRRQVCRDAVKARTFRKLSEINGTAFYYEVDKYIDSLMQERDKERIDGELRASRTRLGQGGGRGSRV